MCSPLNGTMIGQTRGSAPTVVLCGLIAFTSASYAQQDYDEVEKDDPDTIDPETYYAGEVIVTGRRVANMEQAGTSTVVTAKEIEAHGDTTLDEVLDRIPGLQTYTHTKGHTRLRLRGFDQDKVLVLIDGVPINDVYSTDVNIASIAVRNASKIIVNRGVSSALYGTDGAVGTVNIITRKPAEGYTEVKTEFGSQNSAMFNFVHGAPVGKFYYLASGTLIQSNGFTPSAWLTASEKKYWYDLIIRYDLYPFGNPFGRMSPNTFEDVTNPSKNQYLSESGKWDHSQHQKTYVTAKVGYNFSPHLEASISADFYHFQGLTNTYDPNAYSVYRGDRWKANYPNFGDDQDMVSKFALRNRAFVWPYIYRFNVAPYVRWRVGDFSLKASVFLVLQGSNQNGYASTDHEYIKGDTFLLKGQGIYEPFHDMKTFTGYGIRVYPSYKFSRSHRLNMAIHFRDEFYLGEEQAINTEISPNIYGIMGSDAYPVEELRAQKFSLAIEDELHLCDRLKVAVGVSYDMQNFGSFEQRLGESYGPEYIIEDDALLLGTRDSVNPVVGMVFDPIKRRLRLRASGAIKTRFPTLSEYAKIEHTDDDLGLKPERSYNLNGGAELFFMDKAISMRSDYFLSMIDDRIVRLSKDFPPTNADRVVAHGVEGAVKGTIGGFHGVSTLWWSVAYAYVHARNTNYDKNFTVNRGDYLEYTPEHHLNADLHIVFAGGTSFGVWATLLANQRIYVMDSRPIYVESEYSTDYYTTVRLHDPVFLNTRITQTILDDYEISFTVRNLLDDYNADPFNPGPGRTFFLGLSAHWD